MAEQQQTPGGATPPPNPSPLPPAGGAGGQPSDPASRLAAALDGKPPADAGRPGGEQQQQTPAKPSAGQPPAQPAPAEAAPEGYVKASDVQRMVQDQLQQAMKGYRETKAADDARASYQTLKMPDLPQVYRDQLGADPTQWGKQEQQIRQQYRADFKASGGTVPDVGGGNPGGVSAARMTPGPDRRSPTERLADALDKPNG